MQDNKIDNNAIEFYNEVESDQHTIFNKLAQMPTILQAVDIQRLNKRARSKWYTDKISQPLSELDSPLSDYYKNSLSCNAAIKRQGKKLTSKYCNARHCNTCNRIRTAKSINHYAKQFEGYSDLQFTTLTIPNCTGEELKPTIEKMIKMFSNITRVVREKRKIEFNGIRKIEITYNSKMNTYHPHIHILHSGSCGDMFIQEWLKRFPTASIKAQDTKQANTGSVNELFKYTTKILIKDSIDKNTIEVFLPAIDTIMIAMQNKRSFQTFGKMKMISENVEELQSQEYDYLDEEYCTYYVWDTANWVDFYNDEALTSFKPPPTKFKFYE
jgi:hypothetical protein